MAKHGVRVLIVERERQFKDRVRGEFVTSWGVAEARALGIYELLTERVAHQVPWMDFYSGPVLMVHRDTVATTPHQIPCLSFYHPAMQEMLLAAAAAAGAEVRRGVTAQEVRPGVPPVLVVREKKQTEEIGARLIVGADGRSSGVRSYAGFRIQRDPECLLIAGILMDNMSAPEDTGHLVINSDLGQQAVIFPQGAADVPRYLEDCKRTGMNSSFYDGAKPAGPLATFDGAEVWVEHPYRDGVALLGDAAAASDPSWGQGMGLTLRDVRVLRDHLVATEDWDAAAHAYATEHDRHSRAMHLANQWYTQLYLETGPEADARRQRAMPLIAQDPTRQPDTLLSGPDVPLTEEVRKRFFAEE
jgi:2-polyprenyl-6-methoxyphenol hydroxylase-like FAD-dependent oxidoreductase